MVENAVNTPIVRVRTTDRRDDRSPARRDRRGRRVRVRLTRESICSPPLPRVRSPRSRPRARSDARDARSRFAPRARKRPPRRSRYVARTRSRIDEDGLTRATRTRGERAREEGWDGSGRIRVVERERWIATREVGRARREGRRRRGDGRDRGRSIRERILVVDRFGWVRV